MNFPQQQNDGQQFGTLKFFSISMTFRVAYSTSSSPKAKGSNTTTSPKTFSDRYQQTYFDFRYEDEDNLFEEINEFYAFIEADQLAENLRLWQGSFEGGQNQFSFLSYLLTLISIEWTQATQTERKAHIVTLLENMEHRDSLVRYQTTRRLLYLLQGSFLVFWHPPTFTKHHSCRSLC